MTPSGRNKKRRRQEYLEDAEIDVTSTPTKRRRQECLNDGALDTTSTSQNRRGEESVEDIHIKALIIALTQCSLIKPYKETAIEIIATIVLMAKGKIVECNVCSKEEHMSIKTYKEFIKSLNHDGWEFQGEWLGVDKAICGACIKKNTCTKCGEYEPECVNNLCQLCRFGNQY